VFFSVWGGGIGGGVGYLGVGTFRPLFGAPFGGGGLTWCVYWVLGGFCFSWLFVSLVWVGVGGGGGLVVCLFVAVYSFLFVRVGGRFGFLRWVGCFVCGWGVVGEEGGGGVFL